MTRRIRIVGGGAQRPQWGQTAGGAIMLLTRGCIFWVCLSLCSFPVSVETQLDIQFGSSMLNSTLGAATIYHVDNTVSNTPFIDILNGAMNDTARPSVLSFSYGGPEYENDQDGQSIEYTNTKFMQAGLHGISVFVSSGDSGAYFPPDPSQGQTLATVCAAGFVPSYPASSPYVTAVGASALVSQQVGVCPTSVQCSVETGAMITGGQLRPAR